MYIMYVDESGDPGVYNPSKGQTAAKHYALSGLIVASEKWQETFDAIVGIRRMLRSTFNFPMKKELHGCELFNTRGSLTDGNFTYGSRTKRMEIYKTYMEHLGKFSSLRVLSTYLDKSKTKISQDKWVEYSWKNLFERYSTYIKKQGGNANGIVVMDKGNLLQVTRILRKAKVYNPIASTTGPKPYYNNKLDKIIEDPFERISASSYYVQSVDLIVHSLYRMMEPKGAYRRFRAESFYELIDKLLIKEAAGSDPRHLGIKML